VKACRKLSLRWQNRDISGGPQQSLERQHGAEQWDQSVEGASGLGRVKRWSAAPRRGPGDAGRGGFGRSRPQREQRRPRARHPARVWLTRPKRADVRKPTGGRTALRGEVAMFEVGEAAPTASPLGAGDAGNGHPAPAWKVLGSKLRASVDEIPGWKRWSQGRKPGARERDDSTGSRDNKSVAEAGKRHLLRA
jgi:hypothetical protein